MQKSAVRTIAAVSALFAAGAAQASETRGFVVSWFYPSVAAQVSEIDCPTGMNPDAATNVIRILREQGKKPDEIEKIMFEFPNNVYAHIGQRGRIDGKPVSPYSNPLSVPDPNIKLVVGKQSYGFNLDGKADANQDFTNPQTGQSGVDNQLFRVLGCMGIMRAEPGVRPSWPSIQWNTVQLQMPAWLIEVSGIDDIKNDPEVEVRWVSATTPIILDANGEPQADMTFIEDRNPETKNRMKGSIKDGMLITEPMEAFSANGHRWAYAELRMKNAQLGLKLNDDGKGMGYLGGFHRWAPFYTLVAEGGAGYEGMLSMDLPGMYYAFRKAADAEPDPVTGLNLSISSVFTVEVVPAFIIKPDVQTAQQGQ